MLCRANDPPGTQRRILLSVFSSLQIWDSLPKPAVFFTSFCSAYFIWFCTTLWVSGSTIWFLGAWRTFDSFNGTLHLFLSLMFFHLFFSLVPHGLCHLPSLLISSTDFPPSSTVFTFITTSCPLLPYLCLPPSSSPLSSIFIPSSIFHAFISYFHHPPYLPLLLVSFQVKRFLTFMYYRNPPAHTLLQWQIYGTWISILCSMCSAYCAPCPVIILFRCFCRFFPKAAWKTGVDVWTL